MKTSKPCRKCNVVKPLDLFYRNNACKDGRASWCKECQSNLLKQARRDPEKGDSFRFYRYKGLIKKRYGVTVEQYEKMLSDQNGVCAICKQVCQHSIMHKKRLSIDHDHKTNFVRGLLCQFCNKGLGLFKDDINLMRIAIEYLIKAKENEEKSKTTENK